VVEAEMFFRALRSLQRSKYQSLYYALIWLFGATIRATRTHLQRFPAHDLTGHGYSCAAAHGAADALAQTSRR
jgi:hypothetical protein